MIDLRSMFAIAVLSLLPRLARADDVSTDEDVCEGREAGTACNFDGGQGFCRKTTCEGIDYSGGKPKAKSRDCLRCVPEEKVEQKQEAKREPVEAKTDAPVEAKRDAPVEAKTDAALEAKTDAPAEAKVDAPADAKTAEPTKATVSEQKTAPASTSAPASKSCAIDPMPASLGSVALGLGLVVLARRRPPR